MYRILIVEDDFALAEAIRRQLESWGNEALCVQDFQNIIPTFTEYAPHIVLLDVMLPFFNGYHWCREIRRISNVPIVFLSSADCPLMSRKNFRNSLPVRNSGTVGVDRT